MIMTGTIALGGSRLSRSGLNSQPHLIPFNCSSDPFKLLGTSEVMLSFEWASSFFALVYVAISAINVAKQIAKISAVVNIDNGEMLFFLLF